MMRKLLLSVMMVLPLSAWGQLPLNEYVKMDATYNAGRSVSSDLDGYDGAGHGEPDFRAYSSMEATDDGRIIYWGGGHGDYGGNDMDVYDVSANEWYQPTEEENWKNRLQECWAQNPTPPSGHPCEDTAHQARTAHLGQTWTVGGTQPTADQVESVYGSGPVADFLTGRGRPGTRHSYQQATWWPDKGWFVFDYKHSLWAWDPEKGDSNEAFQKLNDNNANQGYSDINFWNIRYDPPSGTLVSFNSADSNAYMLKDGVWEKVIDSSAMGRGDIVSEYHPAEEVHYISRYSNFFIADIPAGTITQIPDSPPQVAGNNGFWIEYSPSRQQMLVMGFDGSGNLGLWGYNSSTATWEKISMTGTVTRHDGDPIANRDLKWDLLERDPVSGNFFVLGIDQAIPGPGVPITAFRLDSNAGDSTLGADPSAHPDNQWVENVIPPGNKLPRYHGKDFQMEYVPSWGDVFVGFGDWFTNELGGTNGTEFMYRIDMENNTWTVLQDHCPTETHQDGWDEVAVAVDHTRDQLWGFPGYAWNDGCGGGVAGRTMYWDIASESWVNDVGGKLLTGSEDDANFGDFDPVTDRMYVNRPSGVGEIDHTIRDDTGTATDEFTDNAMTYYEASPSSSYDFRHVQVSLDRKGRGLYMINRETYPEEAIVRFDLDDKTFTSPEGISTVPAEIPLGNANWVWDPKHRVILFPVGKCDSFGSSSCTRTGEIYAYHVDTAQWENHDLPYENLPPHGNSAGYDEDNELLILFGTKSYPEMEEVFVLQYDPQATGEEESWITGDGPVGDSTTGSPYDVGGQDLTGGTITVTISSPVEVTVVKQNRYLLIDAPQGWGVEITDTDNPGTVISQSDGPNFGSQIVDVTVDDPAGQDAGYRVTPGRAWISAPQNIAMEVQ